MIHTVASFLLLLRIFFEFFEDCTRYPNQGTRSRTPNSNGISQLINQYTLLIVNTFLLQFRCNRTSSRYEVSSIICIMNSNAEALKKLILNPKYTKKKIQLSDGRILSYSECGNLESGIPVGTLLHAYSPNYN